MPRPVGHIDIVWSAEQLAEMRAMVEAASVSIEEIGRRFGCCGHTVRKRAKHLGWKLPTSWLRKPMAERIAAKSRRAPNGCLLWIGPKNHRGYGLMSYQGKLQPLHRITWKMKKGPIPRGLHVLHTCDTPNCIEIEHLFLGTHQDNVDDMITKGRKRTNYDTRPRLTDQQVAEIRNDPRGAFMLAREYPATAETIRRIKLGLTRNPALGRRGRKSPQDANFSHDGG